MMNTDSLVEKALDLYGRGYVPLPLRKHSKHLDVERMGYSPLHFQTKSQKLKELAFTSICYQFSHAHPRKDTVENWFRDFDGNIGILGGCRGLVILDFDRDSVFKTWFERYSRRIETCPVTKSPGGHHVFLRCRIPLETSSLYYGNRKAGHLKSLGGYVVAPPSVLSGDKHYKWKDCYGSNLADTLEIEDVCELGLTGKSPVKIFHDKLRNRGRFEPE